jgi:uncharacterized protein
MTGRMRGWWRRGLAALIIGGVGSLAVAGCGSTSSTRSNAVTVPGQSRAAVTNPAKLEGPEIQALPKMPAPSAKPPAAPTKTASADRRYLETIFNDAQAAWREQFEKAHLPYIPARLVFFSEGVHSGCFQRAVVGPFYCPRDEIVYIDLRFMAMLAETHGPGGFAQAYVVAQRFGHHVQRVLGIEERVELANAIAPDARDARLGRVELQADCLAGVWAHSLYDRRALPESQVRKALDAVDQAGETFESNFKDQKMDPGLWSPRPAPALRWFEKGFTTGTAGDCDAFSSG